MPKRAASADAAPAGGAAGGPKASKKAKQKEQQPEQQQTEQQQPAAVADAGEGAPPVASTSGMQPDGLVTEFKNKEKVLVLSTRGITFRYRHLMNDIIQLLPHCKKDSKLDTKNDRNVLNEVADMKSCSSVIFFEVRKKLDLYLWLSKSPSGPSVKFHVQNVHTMAELKLSGNHLKGSRPVLSFHEAFDRQPHWQLLKEMLGQIFGTPKRHHKSKPFFDHVMSFSIADGRIWMRNYQVVVPLDKKKASAEAATLVEVGPRMCLNPIKIFEGSFTGDTLYENPTYVSPNAIRSAAKRKTASKYRTKIASREQHKAHVRANPMPRSELDDVFADEGDDDGEEDA